MICHIRSTHQRCIIIPQKHDNELDSCHVPQVMQQLCNVDQYFSIFKRLHHLYPSFHMNGLENFLDDGCCDLLSSFLTTNQHFVVAMQKLQFHYDYSKMKVADVLFHSLIREQNPLVDLSNKGEESSNQGTHKSIKYLE